MVGMLPIFAEFERDIIRERVKAGIAKVRVKSKQHGRTPTAQLKKDRVIKLKSEGLNDSENSRELGISRGSIISMLKKGVKIPKGKRRAKITLCLRLEKHRKIEKCSQRTKRHPKWFT